MNKFITPLLATLLVVSSISLVNANDSITSKLTIPVDLTSRVQRNTGDNGNYTISDEMQKFIAKQRKAHYRGKNPYLHQTTTESLPTGKDSVGYSQKGLDITIPVDYDVGP